MVGEHGCTFSPAVYNGKRRKEGYVGQQLIALDFDNGIAFSEIKKRAEQYRLSILFAYKTFSYTSEHEKFRVVFALKTMISDSFTAEVLIAMFMKIFSECDSACKDCSRMFFGGKGLLLLAEESVEISESEVVISFIEYMNDRYGETHYTRELKKFYQRLGVKYEKTVPKIMNGKFIYDGDSSSVKERRCNNSTEKSRREVTRNFDWSVLYNKCRLYRNFVDGLEYYYYPQLFHIATNLVNVEKGKNEFLRIIKSNKNVDYEAYYRRNWKVVLNVIIAMNYQPQGCCDCPYANKCFHAKNMILTAKPGKSTMIQTVKKEYVSIGEAEEDLRNNFHEALNSDKKGVHLIKAQTGIGKTNLYLNLLKQTSDLFLIAVPTHRLKMEIYHKACAMGIVNISYTPELPEFSSDLQDKIKHAYDIGAGEYTITILRKAVQELKPDDPDYILLRNYLDTIDRLKEFHGHIITTHERFILMRTQNTLIEKREIIIDEDIMRTILSTYTVSNDDVFKAIKSGLFTGKAENRLKEIIASEGYQRYDFDSKPKFEMTNDLLHKLENTHGNIIDLVESNYVYRGKTETTFLKSKWLPKEKVVVLSATASGEVYRMLTQYNIHYYSCKNAEYMGKLKVYSKYSFSRYALNHQEGIIEYIKNRIDNDIVITFKQFEKIFHTKYHYGAIEGLNCLAGKNISIVGLPNINDFVYKLYGMAAGLNVDNSIMRSMRIEYNGYSFEINTFESSKLRTIQLWMLESFIEQAVDRARLLRNHCTVKVFARFPVEQAIVE